MTSEPAHSLVGQVLAGTYRVEGLLGKGGMGAVYAAAHLRLPTKVAIKVLHAEAAGNPEIFARFRREAEISSGLRHPNIVQVFDFNHLPDGTPYLVMEFLEGEDLQARIMRQGRLPYEEVVALCRAIGAGLQAAHKREVVHRDLKPQNIFLSRQDEGEHLVEIVKIVDFGISKIRHAQTDTQQTRDQQLLGTPNYMSPEQARGHNSEVDHRTDQWALGAIAYLCLTGHLAFSGDTLANIIYQVVLHEPPPVRSLAPEVPEHAELAIQRALAKARDGRFPQIMDFVRAFAGQPSQGTPVGAGMGAAGRPQGYPGGTPPGPLTPPGPRNLTPRPGDLPTPGGHRGTEFLPTDPALPPPRPTGSVTGAGGQVAPPPLVPARRRLLVGVSGALIGLCAVAGWLFLQRTGPVRDRDLIAATGRVPPPQRPVAAVPDLSTPVGPGQRTEPPGPTDAQVTVRVRATPADATVVVGDRRVPESGEVRVPRGTAKIDVIAIAPGYEEERLQVVPGEDQTVEIKLRPEGSSAHQRDRPRPHHQKTSTTDADEVDISGIK